MKMCTMSASKGGTMPHEITGVTPAYLQISDHYRRKILNGDLLPGHLLPSLTAERDLWNVRGRRVGQSTIERVRKILASEGLIHIVPGVGAEVCTPRPTTPAVSERVANHADNGTAMRRGEHSEILAAEEVPAPVDVAQLLDVHPGTPVHLRRRLVWRDEIPQHMTTSYYLPYVVEAANELAEPVSTGGSRELAAQRLGSAQEVVEERFSARLVSQEEASALRVPNWSAVLVTRRTVTLADGRILEVAVKVTTAGQEAVHVTRL
jgi:DNA-binding GntR family transcriptional regulator